MTAAEDWVRESVRGLSQLKGRPGILEGIVNVGEHEEKKRSFNPQVSRPLGQRAGQGAYI
jgi:hypothetical protein